jgi:DNA-binding MarR family transcriptional regulator
MGMGTTTATSSVSATQIAETLDTLFGRWRRLIPSEGVSLTAGSTLGLLLGSGPLRLTALADREAVSQPAMTGLVSRLEGCGLVLRGADPTDGRAVLVELTDKGCALIQDRRARRAVTMDGLLDLLAPDDRACLDAAIPALWRLIDHATPDENPVSGVEKS